MHSILLVLEKPKDVETELIHEQKFSGTLKTILQKYQSIEVLSESLLQITADDIGCFVEVCTLCTSVKRTYRAIFFEEEPKWVRSTI